MAIGALLLAGVAAVALIGAFGSHAFRTSVAEGGIACMFRELTGLACPFCGLTHATIDLGHGNIGSALAAHPLSPLILLATVWAAVALIRGRRPSIVGKPVTARLIIAVTAVVWIVNLLSHG